MNNIAINCIDALQKSKEGIIIHDTDGKVVQYNKAALELLGLNKDQLLGKTSYDTQWKCVDEFGKTIQGHEHPVSVTLETKKEVYNYSMGVMKPNEITSWILINSYPIYHNEKLSGVLVTFSNQNDLMLYKDRLELALGGSNIGIWDWNLKDNSLYLSRTCKAQLGYENHELENSIETIKSLIHPKDIDRVFSLANDYIKGKKDKFVIKFRLKHKDEHYIWVESTGGLIKNPEGKPIRFIGVHQDIDKKIQNEIKLRQSATIFESSHDSIMITDSNNIIISVNKAFEEVTGYKSQEVMGKSPRILKSNKHESAFYKDMWEQLDKTGSWHGEIWNRDKNGRIYPEWLTIKVNKDSNGNVQNYIAVFSDISELKNYEKKLYFESNHDSLTNLINRKRFYENLDYSLIQSARYKKKIALAFIDIDKFKFINDTYGHDIGDEILIEVANRLKNIFRQSDSIARLGGDEFGFIINNIEHEHQIEIVIDKIIQTIKQPIILSSGKPLYIESSIGISLYPDDGTSPEILMRHSDIAMYKAKEAQVDFCFYDEKYTIYHKEQIELYNDLKKAIVSKKIDVYFQPQIDLDSNIISGVEVLARWKHPKKGDISPAIFIKTCEDFGLIDSLTDIVLQKGLKQLKKFQKFGYLGKLSINISPLQLKTKNIIDLIKKHIYKYDINPIFIELEITETAIIENVKTATSILNELKSLGFNIAIDDFGTGSTSLMHLQNLPLDKIKIDKQFVENIANNEKDQMLVKTVIQLCENMGYQVLVEGVENKEQLKVISSFNCKEIQGFIFAKPMDRKSIKGYLKDKSSFEKVYSNQLSKLKKKTLDDNKDMDIEELTSWLKTQYNELQNQTKQLNASKIQYQKIYEEFRTIFDLAPVGYSIVDQNMQIENSNNYFKKLTHNIKHNYFNLYFNAKSRYRFTQWFNKLNDENVKSIRLTLDGDDIKVQLYGRVFTHNEYKSYFISVVDITQETIKSDELERLNNKLNEMVRDAVDKNVKFQEKYIKEKMEDSKFFAIGQMASGLTHEINTPLTVIKGNLQVLQSDLEAIEDGKTKDYMEDSLQKAYQGIDRIAFMVNVLRELSDEDSSPKKSNIYSSIISALTVTHVKHKHICPILVQSEIFDIKMDKNKYEFISEFSPQRLEQVWVNIINNSLDELVKIQDASKRKLYIDITQTINHVIVQIKDNAGGIEKSVLDHVFEPFVSTKTSSGIGLGMFLTKKIIDDYKGYINIENVDNGALVTIGLPLAK